MNKNYIGITGLTNIHQVEMLVTYFKKFGFIIDSDRIGMIGFLISPRNLDPDWKSSRYPSFKKYKPMLETCKKRVFSTLHIDTKSSFDWLSSLKTLLQKIEPDSEKMMDLIDGIQINVKHPDPCDISELKILYPDLKIILQYANDFIKLDAESVIKDLKAYENIIDYILIDPSRGRGLKIDFRDAINHYKLIDKAINVKIGFAGGLNSENIETFLNDTIQHNDGLNHINFSLDVESGVRDEFNNLDLSKVFKYLKNCQYCIAWNEKWLKKLL